MLTLDQKQNKTKPKANIRERHPEFFFQKIKTKLVGENLDTIIIRLLLLLEYTLKYILTPQETS